MNIGIEKAIKLFFPNPSFPMVFFEAVANAFDADANNVDIKISIPQLSDEQHLNISIEDLIETMKKEMISLKKFQRKNLEQNLPFQPI